MDQAASTRQLTPMLTHCGCDKEVCNGEVVEVATSFAREIYIRLDPASILPGQSTTPKEQAEAFYRCLQRAVAQAGATMANVVFERVFFRDVAADFDAFDRARRAAYAAAGVTGDAMPVASHVQQPPTAAGQIFEVQVFVLVPNSDETAGVTPTEQTNNGPPGKIVRLGKCRHLDARAFIGRGSNGKPLDTFRAQSDEMFDAMGRFLAENGTSFPHVLRTWCYLADIDRDYAQFNLSRNAFFEREAVKRLPASTGIWAGLHPQGTLCATDLYALLDPEHAEIALMHTPTLNEADEYGSAFARGMMVDLPEKKVLYISGTASVDEVGDTVHIGDSEKQIERMLLNVKELLAPHGATFRDLVQVITYLKSAEDDALFRRIWHQWDGEGIPNTVVEAGVCRPNLLCELEAIAVLPKQAGGPRIDPSHTGPEMRAPKAPDSSKKCSRS